MADVKMSKDTGIPEEAGNAFLLGLNEMQLKVYNNAVNHGFWDGPGSSIGEKICLMHDELAELHEFYRDKEKNRGDERDSKIAGFSNGEEEAADLLIRLMDFCEHHNIRLGSATIAKHFYNIGREYRHGRNY